MNYRKKNLICIVPAAIALAGLLYFFKKKRVVKKLFIIGNGFDLYHGIPSSYLQFRDFLHDDDFETYKTLENYLGFYDDDQWRDFESKLAALNSEDLLDEMRIFLGNPGSDDWKDSMYHDFQYEVGQVVDHLNGKMRQSFLRWILQLDTRHRSLRLRLSLPKTEVFLSFNYTDSLEELYKIPFAQILYIHGKAVK